MDDDVLPYVVSVGLYEVSRLRSMEIHHVLVTAGGARRLICSTYQWRAHRNIVGCRTPDGPTVRWSGHNRSPLT